MCQREGRAANDAAGRPATTGSAHRHTCTAAPGSALCLPATSESSCDVGGVSSAMPVYSVGVGIRGMASRAHLASSLRGFPGREPLQPLRLCIVPALSEKPGQRRSTRTLRRCVVARTNARRAPKSARSRRGRVSTVEQGASPTFGPPSSSSNPCELPARR